MRTFLLFTVLAAAPAISFGQAFEAWVGGGVSNLTNGNIGSLDGTSNVVLQNGWLMNFRLGLNTWRFFGHEIGYQYTRANWRIQGADYGSSIHEGNYNFLAYFVPEGAGRVRPYVTGGGEFANFPFPGYSATSGGGSMKWGYNYGAGVKIRVREILGVRFDFRQHSLGKPFDLFNQSGRIKQNELSMAIGVML